MEVCCGDEGAVFPGDYSEPSGYSYSGDVASTFVIIPEPLSFTVIAGMAVLIASVCILMSGLYGRKGRICGAHKGTKSVGPAEEEETITSEEDPFLWP